ncbi:hypothetical protein L0F63_003850 [Massospora cicadina]|nr:hypothetical protein L0F63_003850 [Massospora cicadina]
MQLHVDARALFLRPEFGSFNRRLSKLNVMRTAIKHSYQAQLTSNLQLLLNGTLLAQGGRGGGNLGPTIRHTVSPKLVLEYGCTLLNARIATFKAFYQPSSDSFVNIKATAASLWKPPTTNLVVGRAIGKGLTGFLSYNSGDWRLGRWGQGHRLQPNSSMSVGIASNSGKQELQSQIQVGVLSSQISGQYKRKVTTRTRLVVSGSISDTSGIVLDVGAEHRVLPKTVLGGSVSVGLPSGIGLRFSVSRLGQSLTIPVVVSSEFRSVALLAAVAVPAGLWFLADEFLITPWRTRRYNRKLREFKELNAEYLEDCKLEALRACQLLQDAVARRKKQEELKNGLIIVQALYGKLNESYSVSEECVDVSVPLQNLVHESQLYLVGGHSKSQLFGFYDPSFGSKKQLYIRYLFKSQLHAVVVEDKAPVVCPMRAHAI